MSTLLSNPSIFERLLVTYARHFPVRRGKLRLVDSLWRTATGSLGTRRLANLKYGGFKIACDLEQMIQRQFYFFGTYFLEEGLLHYWHNEARKAGMIFDVGANAGIYSLAALDAQPNAMVHAFEPTPEIAVHLRETAARNGLKNLRVHQTAVLSENGEAALKRFRGEWGTNEGMNFISTEFRAPDAERVEAVCLDQFCKDQAIDRIDLLKLDIQGHEYSALKGAEQLLRNGRIGIVFMELNWAEKESTDASPAEKSIALLEKTGYKFSAAGKHVDWKRSGEWMRNLADIIACRA